MSPLCCLSKTEYLSHRAFCMERLHWVSSAGDCWAPGMEGYSVVDWGGDGAFLPFFKKILLD